MLDYTFKVITCHGIPQINSSVIGKDKFCDEVLIHYNWLDKSFKEVVAFDDLFQECKNYVKTPVFFYYKNSFYSNYTREIIKYYFAPKYHHCIMIKEVWDA